jgi:hypothetical protein
VVEGSGVEACVSDITTTATGVTSMHPCAFTDTSFKCCCAVIAATTLANKKNG